MKSSLVPYLFKFSDKSESVVKMVQDEGDDYGIYEYKNRAE